MIKRRGRPSKFDTSLACFDVTEVKTFRGKDLSFNEDLFIPMKTNSEIDVILSSEGGLMPGTNIVITGGPGSGKSTVALDMLSNLSEKGYRCLFISAEMDEIAFYKYCKRIPKFNNVPTLFLKNYSEQIKHVLEHVLLDGYDVVCVDSIAEVLDMYKDLYKTTENAAESWFLSLQDEHKKGKNTLTKYTAFVNIQQVTKQGDFAGSNRLKHMTDGMCHCVKSKDGLTRSLQFSKNRDCDNDMKIYFSINQGIMYSFEQE